MRAQFNHKLVSILQSFRFFLDNFGKHLRITEINSASEEGAATSERRREQIKIKSAALNV